MAEPVAEADTEAGIDPCGDVNGLVPTGVVSSSPKWAAMSLCGGREPLETIKGSGFDNKVKSSDQRRGRSLDTIGGRSNVETVGSEE